METTEKETHELPQRLQNDEIMWPVAETKPGWRMYEVENPTQSPFSPHRQGSTVPLFDVSGQVTFQATGSIPGLMRGSVVSAVAVACLSRLNNRFTVDKRGGFPSALVEFYWWKCYCNAMCMGCRR